MRVFPCLIGAFASLLAGFAVGWLSGSVGIGVVGSVPIFLIAAHLIWEKREFGDGAGYMSGEEARAGLFNAPTRVYSRFMGVGTAINVVAVLVGGGIGTLVGAKLPEGMRNTAMGAIGIVTLLVGVSNFLEYSNPLVPLVSVVLGLVVGELVGIESGLKRFGDYLEKRFSRGESPVSRAFVTTSLLFCVGPLTIIGSLEDGLTGNYELLALKSALDFIAALAFASVLGWGVLLSAGTVLIVQGTLTIGASFIEPVVTDAMVLAATATGGVLIFGLGLLLLELKEVRVANMLPALVFAPLLVAAAPLWPL
ncbi:MAG: DUF554 domain-containing protein [Rubrobacteraceae bacterium]